MTFYTERLIIRPWEESDAEDLYEYAKDPDVGPRAGWTPHTSVQDSLEVLRNILMVPETYAVCLKTDGRAIGSIGLMIGNDSNMCHGEDEGEIGYWLGVPFWGQGLMPEAVSAIIRHAFVGLGLNTLWCMYFDGNERSAGCMKKCGFGYHHTIDEIMVKAIGQMKTEHVTRLTLDDWKANRAAALSGYSVLKLSEHRELQARAAEWFSGKWGIPYEAYYESIEDSFSAVVPSWYVCMDGDKIIGGMGVIENDFHEREDLTPNVCAVYTEKEYRCRGIAGMLLNHICEDMAEQGIGTLYLLTDHTGFYERYGWEFLCMVTGDGEEEPSRMYIHTMD